MRDEDHREPHLAAQLGEQRQHLRLDRHVERGDGFVGDQHLRPQRERARDTDALALAARELMRIAIRGRRRQPDACQQLPRLRHGLGARGAISHRAACHGVADLLARIEAGEGVLEDNLEARGAPGAAPRRAAAAGPSLPSRIAPESGSVSRMIHPAKGRLAGAGLADQPPAFHLHAASARCRRPRSLPGAAETSRV